MKILAVAALALSVGAPMSTMQAHAGQLDILAHAWAALNEKCRGGSGDEPSTLKACGDREELGAELDKMQGPVHGKYETIVQAWELSSRSCLEAMGADYNPTLPACARQAAIEKKLEALGCQVDQELWKCPRRGKFVFILPGSRGLAYKP